MTVLKEQIKQVCDASHYIPISFKLQSIIFSLHLFKNSLFIIFSSFCDQNNLYMSLVRWPDNEIIICASTQYFILIVHSQIHSLKTFYHSLTRTGVLEACGQWGQFIYSFNKYLLDIYCVRGNILHTGKPDKNPFFAELTCSAGETGNKQIKK